MNKRKQILVLLRKQPLSSKFKRKALLNRTRLLRIKEVTKILTLQLVELIIKMTTRFNLKKILKLLTMFNKIRLKELLNLIQLPQIIKQIHNKIASLRFRKEAIFYCCKTFRGFVPSAGPITPANSNSSINRVARLNPTERRR